MNDESDDLEELLHEIHAGAMVARIWRNLEDPYLPFVTIARRTEVIMGERFIHWRHHYYEDELQAVAELVALSRRWIEKEYLPRLRRERALDD